jgi:hypothetical protein
MLLQRAEEFVRRTGIGVKTWRESRAKSHGRRGVAQESGRAAKLAERENMGAAPVHIVCAIRKGRQFGAQLRNVAVPGQHHRAHPCDRSDKWTAIS